MADRHSNRRRILLVEDETIVATSAKHTIEKHGFDVGVVHSGEEAIRCALSHPTYDLLLMDIDLGGGIDGTEAAQKILAEVKLPIVFLTSHTEKEYVDRVRGITSYGYVIKHSGEFVLTESIRMALELFDAHQQAKEHEESLTEIFHQAPIGIFESRFDGTFRSMNTEMAHMLGFDSPEEAVEYYNDVRAQLYTEPSKRDELLRLLTEYGKVRDFQLDARRASGELISLKMSARVVNRDFDRERVISGFIVDETERRVSERQLAERVKELTCLYGVERLTARMDANIGDLLHEVVKLLPPSWQYPETTCARIVLHDREVTSHEFEESPWSIQADIRTVDRRVGSVEVFYRDEMPEADEGPFLAEERDLIDGVADRLARWLERTEAAEQMQFQSQLLEAVDEAVIATDLAGSITYWNAAAEHVYGWNACEALGKNVNEITVPEISQVQARAVMNTVAAGRNWTGEFVVQNKQGQRFQARISNSPVYEADGSLTGIVGVSYDLTAQKEAAEELGRVSERYKRAERTAQVGHWEMDIAAVHSVWSDEFYRICGYEPQSFSPSAENGFTLIHPEDRDRAAQHVNRAIEKGEPYNIEERIVRPDGEIRWVDSRGEVIYDENHRPVKLIGSFVDITERKRAEERLQSAITAKDRLMSELNHRVKNNLSLVLSLIHLKQNALGDRGDLSDIIGRVGTIRFVHEKLQQSESIGEVDFKSYVEDVLSGAISPRTNPGVEVENEIGDVFLPTKLATTLGLIVNELATNAVKYGFRSQSEKRFNVTMKTDEDSEEYVLTVSNTGREFPDDIDIEHADSLGLQLVTALIGQLGGTMELQRKPYPVFTIRFPMPA